MIGLHAGQVRLVLPVSGALVLGVGMGSAIGWLAGGADTAAPTHAVAASATTAGMVTASLAASSPRSNAPRQDPDAVALLQKAAVVQTATPWSGTQVVTTWSSNGTTSRIVDLSHEPGKGTAARMHATAAEQAEVMFVPDSDGPAASPDELSTGPLALLTRSYALRTQQTTTLVAGRSANEVVAYRDDQTPAAEFWVDQATGMLLSRELLDPTGRVTHSTAFIDVTPGTASGLVAGADVARPWSTELTHQQLDGMGGSGWSCPNELPGGLALYDIRRTPSTTDPVIHLAYSDGLINVSVFEEQGHLDTSALRGFTRKTVAGRVVHVRPGTSQELTWQSGGTVFTVLADVPVSSMPGIVASLPAPTGGAGGSGWSRVKRGLHRIGSWVNPTS